MITLTRNKAVAILVPFFLVSLTVGAILGMYTVPPIEVVTTTTITTTKEAVTTTTTTTTTTVREAVTTTKEVSMKLSILAEKIRNGEIDVGENYGMAPGQRYHTIHATTIGLECTTCHVKEVTPEMVFAQAPPGAPGPVDRRVCLGCHLTGPASNLYGP